MVIGEETLAALIKSARSFIQTGTRVSTADLPPPPPPPPPPLPRRTDVTLMERDAQMTATSSKFDDVYKVHGNCDKFPVDLSKFDDSTNVKGRLHMPESIAFFKEIGASPFIIDTLEH